MTTRDKIIGMFLGVGIGDAIGRHCEGWTHDAVRCAFGRITEYIVPYGWPIGSKAGIGSDDCQLTMAVAEGLLMSGGRPDMDAQVQAHVNAFQHSVQGWGPTTFEAVRRLAYGTPWRMAGARGARITGLGNGTALKMAPVALMLHQDIPRAVEFIADLCSMTHQTSIAISAGLAHAFGLAYCLKSDPTTFNPGAFVEVVVNASKLGRNYFAETLTEDDITERLGQCRDYADWPPERCVAEMEGGRSYVYCSLPFSYIFFLRDLASIESLYEVVSCGGDSDTNASLVSSLLGSLNGSGIFPSCLVDELEARDRLVEMANRLCDMFRIE